MEELRAVASAARSGARGAIERAARMKALKVYLAAAGTLRPFDSAWPRLYSGAWQHERSEDESEHR